MAIETVAQRMKPVLQRIATAIRNYASRQGWGAESYRVFAHLSLGWGRFHILVVLKGVPESSLDNQRLALLHYLRLELDDLVESLDLTLRTEEQVKQGGIYAIGAEFEDIDDLIVLLGAPGLHLRTRPFLG
jgi:hypothetical protein